MRWRFGVLVGLAVAGVPTIPGAAPVGVSCVLSPSYAADVLDRLVADVEVVQEPVAEVSPSFPPWMDVKGSEGPPPFGEERVKAGDVVLRHVALHGCGGDES
jgi:hypothetical protein